MSESVSKKNRNYLWLGGIVVILGLSGLNEVLKMKEMTRLAAESPEVPGQEKQVPVSEASGGALLTSSDDKQAPVITKNLGQKRDDLKALQSAPRVYYRSVRPKEFGRIVVADLKDPSRKRFVSDLKCERAHFDKAGGICLVDNRAEPTPPAYAILVDKNFEETHRLDLAGYPSRSQLSPDGLFAASTVFTTGENYDADFTTQTLIIDRTTGEGLPNLETFAVYQDDKLIQAEDFNFWGVTFFDDSNRFHATLRTADKTFLLLGDIEKRRFTVLRDNVECPSLSPDQKRIAFKKLVAGPGEWRVHVMDLRTLTDRAVSSEQKSIDDQIEWLDNDHLLYGTTMDRGAPEDAMNVWRTPVDGGQPELFLKGASSPSVVR